MSNYFNWSTSTIDFEDYRYNFVKKGSFYILDFYFKPLSTYTGNKTIFTISTGYRPKYNTYVSIGSSTNVYGFYAQLYTNGNCIISGSITASKPYAGKIIYI